jgi:hypothetical protein
MEILHAQAALERADAKKHPAIAFLEVAVFWGLLFLTLVGIFAVSVIIVPLLLVLDTITLAFILALLGLCLGTLFALLIQDVEWAERRHHALNLVVLAVVAVVNIWFIVTKIDALGAALSLRHSHPAWLLGFVFAAALLAPYAFHLAFERRGAGHA